MAEITDTVLAALWLICTVFAMFGSAYLVIGAVLIWRFTGASPADLRSAPGVTILKPLCGTEPGLEANLASFCTQSYPGPVQIIFGVSDAADPAIAVVRRLKERFPRLAVDLVIDPRVLGPNRKISNVNNIMQRCRHDVLVLSDSDIRVDHTYLQRVVAALAQPRVGLVTCLYRGVAAAGIWSRLSAMGIDYHFLPNVMVGLSLGLARPCFGSTLALSSETLSRIGGFAAFSNQLADDYAIGRAVRGLGLDVSIPPLVVDHVCSEATWRDLVRQEARWTRTICLIDPLGYAGSIVTHPLPFAIAAAGLQGFSATGFGMIALALACRLVAPIHIYRKHGRDFLSLCLAPVRDLLSFAMLLASFIPGQIIWRGQRYAVRSDGTLTPVEG